MEYTAGLSLRAERSNPVWRKSGLRRRFAPRNDDRLWRSNFIRASRFIPGKWLRAEIVQSAGLNVTDLADHLGVSRQSMSKLLNGHQGLSAEMAIRFEKAFGLKADTLLRMQSAWELAEARAREHEIAVERVAA